MDVREKLIELIKEGIHKGLRARGDDRLDYSFEDVAEVESAYRWNETPPKGEE